MRISDWSSDVCSSDLRHQYWPSGRSMPGNLRERFRRQSKTRYFRGEGNELLEIKCYWRQSQWPFVDGSDVRCKGRGTGDAGSVHWAGLGRSEEHTSELQSLMRISYAVFCLKKKNKNTQNHQSILTLTHIIANIY